MKPLFFSTHLQFRTWLKKNHKKETELLVGFYKVTSGKKSMTWPQSVDEALCYGWIDGIRKSIDEEAYTIRFTPRKKNSIWSAINIKKMDELVKKGLMQPEGLAAFQHRKDDKSAIYSYERVPAELDKAFETKFKANKKAWTNFQAMSPSYRRTAIAWVMRAKQHSTQIRRMDTLITDSENNVRIKPLNY
ncbi:MAG TPA: YdeI/OmpD-associated family protein [Bacteroidia bacterium]|nr:YdeI/OmpD-associated family protein [Bacteroidia bacterium]